MICPRCQNQLPDNSIACNRCGMQFQYQQQPQMQYQQQPQMQYQQPIQQPVQPQLDPSQMAAQAELKKKQSEGIILPATSIGLGVMLLMLGIYVKAAIFVGLFFIIIGSIALAVRFKRILELKKLSAGQKMVSVCPKCKSTNIQMSMVQASSVTTQGKTTVGDNINPLKPFTHTNIKHGPETTYNNYTNKCHCLACGYVFNKPEIIYQ